MKRQFAAFVVLNVVVAVLAALAVLLIWDGARQRAVAPLATVVVYATLTPALHVTVVTATPGGAATPPPSDGDNGAASTHVVRAGENCWTIAESYGITVNALLRANQLDARCLLYPGDELTIPTGDEPAVVDTGPREAVVTYTVQPGDTVFGIAYAFGLRPESLFWANEETLPDVHLLAVGQELYIPPVDGVLHLASGDESVAQIAAQYGVEVAVILDAPYNHLTDAAPAARPRPGTPIMIPEARGEIPEDLFRQVVESSPPEGTNGDLASGGAGAVGGFAPGHPGSCGWTAVSYGGAGSFRWPLPSFSVWADYADPWHRGIDLGGVPGVPVFAADNGTVIFAGWNNWGYGNMVVLDHGNGFRTLYAHLDQARLRCGQGVNGGQVVGTLGTTGNTAGPHVHFEIRLNGVPVNPRDYIN